MGSIKKYSTRSSSQSQEKSKRKSSKVIVISSDEEELEDFSYKSHNNHSTPPKQRKIVNENSPSTLISSLNLTSPQKGDSCKKLFDDKPNESKIVSARKALHSSVPTEMPGREKELSILKGFIRDHLENRTSGSLYISGPPGTGKTASLNIILRQEDVSVHFFIFNIYFIYIL